MKKSSGNSGSRNEFQLRSLVAMLLGAAFAADAARSRGEERVRDAFFGETHIHTSWSFDAYVFGNTLTGPDEAYQDIALGKGPSGIPPATWSRASGRSTSRP